MSIPNLHSGNETAHLLRSPANAQRLVAAIKEIENGKAQRRDLSFLK